MEEARKALLSIGYFLACIPMVFWASSFFKDEFGAPIGFNLIGWVFVTILGSACLVSWLIWIRYLEKQIKKLTAEK